MFSWQADDLDSLIADSLSGVQAALDGDRKVLRQSPVGMRGSEDWQHNKHVYIMGVCIYIYI